jgi:ATP-dependent helicase/nuclease subunit A
MTRPSDWQQRKLGRDLGHSYIVQAPAGSGKTELLIQRMLGLLAHVEHPEEVVAITFTRKAAAEMSHRLVKRLMEASVNSDDKPLEPHEQVSRNLALAALENDAKQGWNLLQQTNRLRIRTIDSLCSELARQLPVLSGLGGGQQIALDAKALYRKAATRTMAMIEVDKAELQADVIRVLGRYDNQYDKLVELLTGMLASREQWIDHLQDSREGDGFDRQGLELALRYLVVSQLQKARDNTPDELLSKLAHYFKFALAHAPDDEVEMKNLLLACGGVDIDFLDLPVNADALPHWQTMIKRLLVQGGKKWRGAPAAPAGFPAQGGASAEDKPLFKEMKDGFKALMDEHGGNDALRADFYAINSLPSPEYDDEAWESLESLMRILLRAAKEWDAVMAETGEVDFGEVSSRAIKALGTGDAPSELALRLDYRIQHLLVDEFQDTSASQIHLLDKLTSGWSYDDGRTLFLVGDPMQSIYRFRKAEVSLFIKAWEGQLFDHIQLEPLQLSVNFRSTRPIVDWVNGNFPTVMPKRSDAVMGAVSYSPADTKPGVSDKGGVSIRILPERDDEEEARQLVAVIRDTARANPDGSIAILVRSRNHASAILAELDKHKQEDPSCRYRAISFTPLADTTMIRDLVSLTLAITQPADRLAWLATLRTPFIGLDLADLDTLVAGDSGKIILDAVSTAASDEVYPGFSNEGQQRLRRGGSILEQAVNRRGRQSARSLIETTWVALGGPACIENDSELNDAATYFALLDSLEAESLPIDRDTLDLRMKDLYAEPDTEASDKLQVMTIYAAKGLEFDTVILPGLNRSPRNDDNKLLHWFELPGMDTIVMSPMRNTDEKEKKKKSGDLIKFITLIERQRQSLEDGRLLYVASTRAIHNLYLFAAIKPSAKGDIKAAANTLLGGLWPAIEEAQTPLIEQAAEQMGNPEGEETDTEKETPALNLPQEYRRLAADWRIPKPAPSVQMPDAPGVESQDYIEFSWAGEDARLTGNLVHRLLQQIGEEGLDTWEAHGDPNQYSHWCRQQLASDGVQNAKADKIVDDAIKAIKTCLASEKGRWILANHQDASCEYAITAVLDQQPKNLVLDRTFVEKGTRWIIDYKTSNHKGSGLEEFLQNEGKRYREQLQGYKNAMALTETLPIKTALYFPLLDRLYEVDTEG